MNVLYIQTSNSGIAYWRIRNFVRAAELTGALNAHHLFWMKDLTEMHPWQVDIANPVLRRRITGQLFGALQNVDVVIMQIVHTDEALGMFYAIQDSLNDIRPSRS